METSFRLTRDRTRRIVEQDGALELLLRLLVSLGLDRALWLLGLSQRLLEWRTSQRADSGDLAKAALTPVFRRTTRPGVSKEPHTG